MNRLSLRFGLVGPTERSRGRSFWVLPIVALLCASCATLPKRVIRDTQTYTLEILAGLQRESEAASALEAAAVLARDAGDAELCQQFYTPALTIQVKAQAQAFRALYLAGLPYPQEDGSVSTEAQEDPGPARTIEADEVTTFCLPDAGGDDE